MIARLLAPALAALTFTSLHAQEEEPPPEAPTQTLKSEETEALREANGELVMVEGRILRIGATSGGGVHFLNMSPDYEGFVAVVYRSDLENFADGLDGYQGKTVRVTGKVQLFRDTVPQIVVKSPEQIEVVATEEEESPKEEAETPADPSQPE